MKNKQERMRIYDTAERPCSTHFRASSYTDCESFWENIENTVEHLIIERNLWFDKFLESQRAYIAHLEKYGD